MEPLIDIATNTAVFCIYSDSPDEVLLRSRYQRFHTFEELSTQVLAVVGLMDNEPVSVKLVKLILL